MAQFAMVQEFESIVVISISMPETTHRRFAFLGYFLIFTK
jgi:hypothetical protein